MLDSKYIQKYILNTAELADEETFRRLYDCLPDFRKEKVDRIRSEEGKRESLGAFILLQKGICEALELREVDITQNPNGFWSDFKMQKGKNGKPFLAAAPDIHFSLSHTRGRAMCVVSGNQVGCDIEFIREATPEEIKKIVKISDRFFCPEECAFLELTEDHEQKVELFYKIWTMKEAYIKYTGLGMEQGLSTFNVLEFHNELKSITQVEDGYAYTICSPVL